MKHLLSLLLILFCVVGALAQDVYPIIGSGLCEVVIDVTGVGNVSPVMATLFDSSDVVLWGAVVAHDEVATTRLPVGVASYRLELLTASGDEGQYTISARDDCPAGIDDSGRYILEATPTPIQRVELLTVVDLDYPSLLGALRDWLRLFDPVPEPTPEATAAP